jgi:hypothetical protein
MGRGIIYSVNMKGTTLTKWTFAENGESIAPLCGHSKHLDEGVGNFARER